MLTAGIVTVRKGSAFWEFWKDAWAFETLMESGALVLGLTGAILITISMWAAALLAIPLAIIYTAFRKSVAETRRSAELAERNADLAYDLQDRLEELEETQADLIVKSEKLASIGTTAASVVHEVKNVMTNTAIRSGMLLKKSDLFLKSERAVSYVESIHESTERVNTLVQELLAYSRADKTPKPMRIEDAMKVTADLVEKRAYKEQVTIRRNFADVPGIMGVSSQLQQVFMNLLMNAIDATPAGGIITLGTRVEGDSVVASVRDTGSGIPDDIQDRIFDAFFTTKEEGKGTGLGMFVCRRIVTDHEGEIEINSKVGLGTEMILRFRAVEEVEQEQEGPSPIEINRYRVTQELDACPELKAVAN
jgi:signal transduction histidine kinase